MDSIGGVSMDHANVCSLADHEWENIKLFVLMTGMTFEDVMSALTFYIKSVREREVTEDLFNGL